MRWNLRLAAANRGIWQASEMQRLLAEHGLVISAGKMSHLWSGSPASIKLTDLDVICVVLGCEVGELLIPEPDSVTRPDSGIDTVAITATERPRVVPRRRDGRSMPPV
ncbi:helix-turn-helix domain-containing protein [Nocardia amikacinitolerans]|uniref:helix-turn-helix domain-containing protein n=1 Tax=Nocardia amikacinitolerans TaxID=756689 RepID=UPI0020A519EA|nr:helix-turn-helix transcriptional regulator [Nocardia amikacinitolerans]MCP2290798.1 DNA-binding transcriptional regulator, XRE family [Nocardia amikacinitolerans]